MENQVVLKSGLRKSRLMIDIVCFAYFILFLYAASSKLLDYERSKLQMLKSPIITDFAFFLVWFVPVLEIIIGVLLLIRKTILPSLYAALALMSAFTAYIMAILNFSDSIPCSCGGVLERLGWSEHLIFNLIFMVMAIVAILLQTKINEKGRVKTVQTIF